MTVTLNRPLLEVSDLRTYFPFGSRGFGKREVVKAVDGVDLSVEQYEVLALVGESGSGKTTLGRSVLRLVEPTEGTIRFDGIDIMALTAREIRPLRRRMQIIFQDPYRSLSPRMQIKQIIAEPLKLHRIVPHDDVQQRVAELLAKVGLEPYFMHRYPHEMSGGQRQRIAIARALALKPDFIVADEPVSALDVSVQAGILNILLKLQQSEGVALLFISHDLAVVERIADRIAVMYRGKIVEQAETDELIQRPLHPYTQALLSAALSEKPDSKRARIRLSVEPSSMVGPARGCPFAPRCPKVQGICRRMAPPLQRKAANRVAACHLR